MEIHLRGLHRFMTEPKRNDRAIGIARIRRQRSRRAGSLIATYRQKAWIAASRTLRVRDVLRRCRSDAYRDCSEGLGR
jgi:hypothetical protein